MHRSSSPAARLAVVGAAVLVALSVALTGCAPDSSPDPTPSASGDVAAACAQVRETVDDAVAAFGSIDPADPESAAAALDRLAASVSDAAGRVPDAALAGILPRLESALEDSAEIMGQIADGDLGRAAALTGPAQEVQSAFDDYAAACAPAEG